MADLLFIFPDKSVMRRLTVAMQQVSFNLQEKGPPKYTAEGLEQDWKCCDKSGDLFYFGTIEVGEKNWLDLKAGTFCLILGPGASERKRKEIRDAGIHLERIMIASGAQRAPRQ